MMISDEEKINKQLQNIKSSSKKNKDDLIKELVYNYMEKYGITNPYIKSAMMGIILSEGGLGGVAENMYYTTPGRLAEVWSVFSNYKNKKGQTIPAPEGKGSEYANELAKSGKYLKNPEALGNFVYGNILGNKEEGDGYKYRGRGLNQLTGKGSYKKLGDELGIDLVNYPELLETDPDLQAHAAVKFLHNRISKELPYLVEKYSRYKKRFGNYIDYNNINNIEAANFLLTSANAGFGKKPKKETFNKRLNLSKKYMEDFNLEDTPNIFNTSEKRFTSEVLDENQKIKPDSPTEAELISASPLPIAPHRAPYDYDETATINPSTVQNYSPEEIKRQEKFKEVLKTPIFPATYNNNPLFGRGHLFGKTAQQKKAGGKIYIKPENKGKFTAKANSAGMGVQAFANKVLGASEGTYPSSTRRQANFARNASKWNRNGGHIYPRYFKNGGSGNNQPINPIMFNVDAETENLKIWDPKSQSYVVSNIPYTGDTTGMMSHWADRYTEDDTNQKAIYAKLKKQQDFIDWEAQRVDMARQQLADRTDKLGKGQTGSGTSLSDFLPAATARTLMPSGGPYAFGCTAGSTGCFPPTEEELNDPNFQNQLTIPYFVESKRDLINPALSRNRTKYFTAPKDFKSTYSGYTFRPNIFPQYSVPNIRQYFNKDGKLVSGPDASNFAYSKLKNPNKPEGTPLYRTTIQGINWQNRKKAKPGDPLNVYTGSASYLSQLAKLGMGEVPVGEWLEPGDRITKGGRSDGKIYLGGKGGHYHNTGIGNFVPCIGGDEECGDSLLKGYHNPGNPYAGFFSSGYWDRYNTRYLNNYLISRYEGDLPYHKYTKKEVQNKYGFNDAETDAFMKNYERSQIPITKLPHQFTDKIEIDTSLPTELQDSRSEKEKKKDEKELKKYYKKYGVTLEKGGSLGKPCPPGQIYSPDAKTCVPYYIWEGVQKHKKKADFDMQEVKNINEAYYDSYNWLHDYYNSPKYKELVRSSYPEGSEGDVAADELTKLRLTQLESTPPIQIFKPHDPLSHYHMDPEESPLGYSENRSGQISLIDLPNYGFREGTTIHELSHSSDRPYRGHFGEPKRLIPESDTDWINKAKPKYLGDTREYWNWKNYYDWLKKTDIDKYRDKQKKWIDWTNYITGQQGTETRARMLDIKKLAQDRLIYDPFTEDFEYKHYEQLKKIQDSKLNKPLRELQDAYSDDEIMWMMNNISKVESKKSDKDINDTETMA